MKLRKLGRFKNACACKSIWRLMHAKIQIADLSPQNTRIKKKNKRLEPFHMRQHMHGMGRVIVQSGKYNAHLKFASGVTTGLSDIMSAT
jgi:hypothetical protein